MATYSGIRSALLTIGAKVNNPATNGAMLNLNLGPRIQAIPGGKIVDWVYGWEQLRIRQGWHLPNPFRLGRRKSLKPGSEIKYNVGPKARRTGPGYHLAPLHFDSNIGYKVDLLVTPTVTYEESGMLVEANYKDFNTGKFALSINGVVVIPQEADTGDISKLSFIIDLSKLVYGDNQCRLDYYPQEQTMRYVKFTVTSEQLTRTISKRTFHKYTGGFIRDSGVRYDIADDAWEVSDLGKSAIVLTSDLTSVPTRYNSGILGINVDGYNCLFYVSFDKCNTWYSFIGGLWTQCQSDDIATNGMSITTMAAITQAQWQSIFQNTQIDFMVYMMASQLTKLKNISVLLPANSPPQVTDLVLSPAVTHAGTTVTAHIKDMDGDFAQYRILVNGEVFQDFNSNSTSSEYDISIAIPNDKLMIGTTDIAIQTYDGLAYGSPYTTYLTKVDAKPAISGVLDKLNLTAVLTDDDVEDVVRYRILVNGVIKIEWTSYIEPPFEVDYTIEQRDVIVGSQNTVTLEVQDNLGVVTSADFDFVGQNTDANKRYVFIL